MQVRSRRAFGCIPMVLLAMAALAAGVAVAAGPASRPASRPAEPELRPFGKPGTGAIGPKGPAALLPGETVFVCDVSGLPQADVDFVKDQLVTQVGKLRSGQEFNVVVAGNVKPVVFSDKGLVDATKENLARLGEFVKGLKAVEKADPLAALDVGLAKGPQVVYFLTHKGFADPDAASKKITALNKNGGTRVNVLVVGSAALEVPGTTLAALKKIAKENGGGFAYVKMDEFKAGEAKSEGGKK